MADELTAQQAEEQQTPESQEQVEETQQEEWTTESLTEAIEEAALSGDTEKMDELRQLFDNQTGAEAQPTEPGDKPEETPVEEPSETQETKPATEEEKKLFKVTYHGNAHEIEDPNGLLGFETTGHLKRAKVHGDLRIKDLESRYEEATNHARSAAAKLAELEAKYKELEGKAASTPAPQQAPQQAPAENSTATSQAAEKVERPVAPPYPALSTNDPNDYTSEDIEKLTEWQGKQTAYMEQNTKYLDYLTNLAERKSEIPSAEIDRIVQDRTKDQESQIRALQEKLKEVDNEKATIQQQKAEQEYWDHFTRFQSQHKQFSTPAPLPELHKKVGKWMDDLAAAHGHNPPYTPYDANSEQWQAYNRMRSAIVDSYLSGNQETLNKSEGVNPPDGYKEYFKLGDLYRELKPIIERGNTFHQAYLIHLDETGQLDQTVDELRVEERAKASKATGDALRDHTNHPSAIPNDVAQQGQPGQGISEGDISWLMGVLDDPTAYASLPPDQQKRADAIASAAGVPIK